MKAATGLIPAKLCQEGAVGSLVLGKGTEQERQVVRSLRAGRLFGDEILLGD